MDSVAAKYLAAELLGKKVGGWEVGELIDHGKSAAVFHASDDGRAGVIKVFDREIVERYGDKAQQGRIERELTLIGQTHPNLVAIYGGGYDTATALYFVVMEFVAGTNLRKALPSVPTTKIPTLIRQIAAAARFLEERRLVHRDIKPENIMLSDDGSKTVLLDLGVVRPIGAPGLTDENGVQAFIGTLQYASPEFLLREEKNTLPGWRALTFYQIGAVLHDLITRRPLFEQFAYPYAKLVNAVQHERPVIANPDVPTHWITLADKCLIKNSETRLSLLSWDSFELQDSDERQVPAKGRVREQLAVLSATTTEPARREPAAALTTGLRKSALDSMRAAALACRNSIAGLPPLGSAAIPDRKDGIVLRLEPTADRGFPYGLSLAVTVEVLDPAERVLKCCGIGFIDTADVKAPPQPSAVWFEDILDANALTSAFEDFFFKCVEWALRVSPGLTAGVGRVLGPAADGDG